MRPYDASLDTLRGFACLLLVSFHVIGGGPDAGMHVADDSGWRLFTSLAVHVRMPLFAVISGYLFSITVASWREVGDVMRRKLRRLGIPFLVVSHLFYLAACPVGSRYCAVPLWHVLVLPYAHYWFLPATLILMFTVAAGTLLAGARLRLFAALALPVSALLFLGVPPFPVDLFCINGAIYLLPCFLIGYTLRVWSVPALLEAAPRWRLGVLLALGAILVPAYIELYAMIAAHPELEDPKRSLFRLFLSVTACSFLLLLRPRLRLLAALGSFTYAIYLFHPFATSASRRALALLGVNPSPPVLFATGLLLGVLVPVVVQSIAVRQRVTALLLLGIDAAPAGPALVPQVERR